MIQRGILCCPINLCSKICFFSSTLSFTRIIIISLFLFARDEGDGNATVHYVISLVFFFEQILILCNSTLTYTDIHNCMKNLITLKKKNVRQTRSLEMFEHPYLFKIG